jgi:hypothetical protein
MVWGAIVKSNYHRHDDEWLKGISDREKNVTRYGWAVISAVVGIVGTAVVALVAAILIAIMVMMYIVVAMN